MMLYSIYIDLKSKNGQLLRTGTIYANSVTQSQINFISTLWLLGVSSANSITFRDVTEWHKDDNFNIWRSDKFSFETMNEETVEIQYIKSRK